MKNSQETVEHLEYLFETESLKDRSIFEELMDRYSELNKMLFAFIKSVEEQHETELFSFDEKGSDDVKDKI